MMKPYVMVASTDPAVADTRIGSVRQYSVVKGDTFLDLARFYGLGYNELEQANPDVDPWIPAYKSQTVILPTAWIIPQGAHKGVVVNIPEMRLYYFHPRQTASRNASRRIPSASAATNGARRRASSRCRARRRTRPG
jgi:hypothetical protein